MSTTNIKMNNLPKITVVTPSYNQAEFLERTILSVIEQQYPNLEYIVIDGGSTDDSVDIIKKYERYIDYWVSEPDKGQSHAINKGLKMATGEWVAWQNSDDIYYPEAFMTLSRAAMKKPDVGLIIGDMNLIDEQDRVIRDLHFVKPSYKAMVAEGMVLSNQVAFWRREAHHKLGWLDESLHLGFDFDWFLRLTKSMNGHAVHKCLGAFRIHGAAKTQTLTGQNKSTHRIIRDRHNAYMSKFQLIAYRAKRFSQLLLRGDLLYVSRGLLKRFGILEDPDKNRHKVN